MPASGKLLVITSSERSYAVPVDDVAEIIRVPAISRVPHAPKSLLGVANFRNTALPVVSLANLLGSCNSEEASDDTRIVVIAGSTLAGLLVDRVGVISGHSDQHEILDARALLDSEFSSKPRVSAGQQIVPGRAGTDVQVESGVDKERKAFISFEVAGQDYALPLAEVLAIAALPAEVTQVPRTDDAIAGIAEIGRALVPLISLRALLGLSEEGFDSTKAHVAVVHLAGKSVGLVTDSMKSVLRVEESSLDAVPTVLTRGAGEAAINAICRFEGGGLVSILAVDRLFDAETTRRLTASVASGGAQMVSEEAGALEQLLIFELGRERYGLPIAAVDEVVRRPDRLTRVPRAPAFVDGIMSLRGKMIPVIDQRQRFSLEGEADRRASRVIVLTIDGLQTGITVDRVSEILSVAVDDLKPAPDMNMSGPVIDRIVIGRGGDMVLVIEPKALLDRAERDMLAAMRNDHEGQRE